MRRTIGHFSGSALGEITKGGIRRNSDGIKKREHECPNGQRQWRVVGSNPTRFGGSSVW